MKKKSLRLMLAIVLLALMCACADTGNSSVSNGTEPTWAPTTDETVKPAQKAAPDPTAEPTIEPTAEPTQEPISEMTSYGPGTLKVGADIPAGEYVLLATGSRSGYFAVCSDANCDDILFNDNFDTNSIITVYDGEFLNLSRCEAISEEEFHSEYTIKSSVSGTMLKVGVDLEAGEYKLLCESDQSGYYCIYNDSRQSDIISNDNFENSSYVSVEDGQYLVLSRCYIEQ